MGVSIWTPWRNIFSRLAYKENLLQDPGHDRHGDQVQAQGAHLRRSGTPSSFPCIGSTCWPSTTIQKLLYHQVPSEQEEQAHAARPDLLRLAGGSLVQDRVLPEPERSRAPPVLLRPVSVHADSRAGSRRQHADVYRLDSALQREDPAFAPRRSSAKTRAVLARDPPGVPQAAASCARVGLLC